MNDQRKHGGAPMSGTDYLAIVRRLEARGVCPLGAACIEITDGLWTEIMYGLWYQHHPDPDLAAAIIGIDEDKAGAIAHNWDRWHNGTHLSSVSIAYAAGLGPLIEQYLEREEARVK